MNAEKYSFEWNEKSRFKKKYSELIQNIEGLFKYWNKLLIKYERKWQTYLPYAHNQRANVGLLAIAASKLGAYPFLEYSQEKLREDGTRYPGEADLSIWWDVPDREITIEATLIDISCFSKKMRNITKDRLRKSLNDELRKVKSHYRVPKPRLALVFARLYLASGDFNREQFCNELLKAAWFGKADFCTVHFCEKELWKKSKDNSYPGIAVIGKFHI